MITGVFSVLTIIMGVVAVIGPVGAILAMLLVPGFAIPVIQGFVRGFLACRICVLVVAVLVACVGSYWIGRNGAYDKGVNDTVARVARGDAKVVDRALKARSKLKDCQGQGLSWDQTTGTCR